MWVSAALRLCGWLCLYLLALAVEWGEASEGVELEGDGTAVCPSGSGGSGIDYNYALLDCCFTTGRHAWDVTLTFDAPGSEGQHVAFGVAREHPAANFRRSGEMWMYECNGDLHMQGAPQRSLLPRRIRDSETRTRPAAARGQSPG